MRYLAGEAGVRQFLDIGTGLPTMQNTHEVAQAIAPDARIVYVDNDRCKSGCAHVSPPVVWQLGDRPRRRTTTGVTPPGSGVPAPASMEPEGVVAPA